MVMACFYWVVLSGLFHGDGTSCTASSWATATLSFFVPYATAENRVENREKHGARMLTPMQEEYVERVLQECLVHMRKERQNHILISSLGTALSVPARALLRRTHLSLMRLLARFPNEFQLSLPAKGCDRVYWYGPRAAVDMNSAVL